MLYHTATEIRHMESDILNDTAPCPACGMPIIASCRLNRKISFVCDSFFSGDDFLFHQSKACAFTSAIEEFYLSEIDRSNRKPRDTLELIKRATSLATGQADKIEGTHQTKHY